MADERPCDLCGLAVGPHPFRLEAAGRTLEFCCDGCLGIWRMLHESEPDAEPNAPPEQAINQRGRS
ncbi:MAG: hypothetical protein PHS77_02260 [Gallionellaceae bacterium]|nr:hypothetical protein [Gallionellaceae bacterium]